MISQTQIQLLVFGGIKNKYSACFFQHIVVCFPIYITFRNYDVIFYIFLCNFSCFSVHDVTPGFLDITSGFLDITPGFLDITLGLLDITLGFLDITPGFLDITFGFLDTTSSPRSRKNSI